ncbi:MAG: hypothetical protein US75_C0036G0004 [Candidatus Woesebacteria bacterium GW2011_GWC1_38_13]|uniref:Uncharacterized protein n=1 Tax=Candidatus Woesebacteria bacterium GW2011_GWC1_38_13 TaxID=1618583 RepID=A0A0G0II24_9BACT|nr:MAG: hypothetical protein US75_C0036G0004 [Candidatus Woesebacteria bacterium GW2011_GWC1_38_13]
MDENKVAPTIIGVVSSVETNEEMVLDLSIKRKLSEMV